MTETAASDLLQGTLELLILEILTLEPMHGWGLSQRLRQLSDDVFVVNPGSLYPALQRLRSRGMIQSFWDLTENNRRARYYELTPPGRAQLEREREAWARASGAVDRILSATT